MSEDNKLKISLAHKGRKLSPSHVQSLKDSWEGRTMTDEHKLAMRIAREKVTSRPEYRAKLSASLKGKPKSPEAIKKRSGENHYNWKGGVTPSAKKVRNSKEYKIWRKSVFERDDFTCVWCGKRGGDLNADHIKPFAHFPELRFAIDNGRTLCIPCHRTTFKEIWR